MHSLCTRISLEPGQRSISQLQIKHKRLLLIQHSSEHTLSTRKQGEYTWEMQIIFRSRGPMGFVMQLFTIRISTLLHHTDPTLTIRNISRALAEVTDYQGLGIQLGLPLHELNKLRQTTSVWKGGRWKCLLCGSKDLTLNGRTSTDLHGTIVRLADLIRRRKYHVPGPQSLWHIDGNHKLIRYGNYE